MGCFIVLLALVALPFMLAFIVMLFGFVATCIIAFVLSLIIFLILQKEQVFKKYNNCDKKWKRIVSKICMAVLIVTIVFSFIGSILGSLIIYDIFG